MAAARRSLWFRILRGVALGYLLALLAVMLFENKLIFFPAKYPEGDWKPRGIAVEDAWFQAGDGTKLHGWFVPHSAPKAFVLIAHGNGGNITHRIDLLRELSRMGAASMIFDYRGYGRSEGSPTGEGILADARAARDWLAKRAGVAPEQLVMFGESLGGAVAVQIAAEGGARGLVVDRSFCSLVDVAAHHYPWLPVKLLMRTKLDAAAAIGKYRGPMLQGHGDADTIVPYECGQRLFVAANEPKEFVTVKGGDHNDGLSPEFLRALERFLGRI